MPPELCTELCWTIQTSFNLTAALDILVVTVIFFGITLFLRGTQAETLLRGMLILVVFAVGIAALLPLVAFRWLLGNLIAAALIAIPILFQPELRRALERVGRAGLLFGSHPSQKSTRMHIIEAICQTAQRLAERRQGALIVLERGVSLQEYIDTGVPLDAEVTPQLLLTIFWIKTELHDGAVIIRDGKLTAAACVLPLSSGRNLTDRKMGTRHRAGLGISEVSDAICVIVSEETSQISVAQSGRIIRRLEVQRLQAILEALYGEPPRISGLKAIREWVDQTFRLRKNAS
jgi:diadenylate cyclase